MISLETAKALRDAGLAWEPKELDNYFVAHREVHGACTLSSKHICESFKAHLENCSYLKQCLYIWLPSLSQLLAEIEKRGYTWILYAPNNEGKYGIDIGKGLIYNNNMVVMSDSPEEAVAQALLWILKEES